MKILKKLLKLIIYLVSIISLIIIGGNINYCSNQNNNNNQKTQERRTKKSINTNGTDSILKNSLWSLPNIENVEDYIQNTLGVNGYSVGMITYDLLQGKIYVIDTQDFDNLSNYGENPLNAVPVPDGITQASNYDYVLNFFTPYNLSSENIFLEIGNLFDNLELAIKLNVNISNRKVWSIYGFSHDRLEDWVINSLTRNSVSSQLRNFSVNITSSDLNNYGNNLSFFLSFPCVDTYTENIVYLPLVQNIRTTNNSINAEKIQLDFFLERTSLVNELNQEIYNLNQENGQLIANNQGLQEENRNLFNQNQILQQENETLEQNYNQAYNEGLKEGQQQAFNIINFLERILMMLDNILNIEILPYIKLWYIVAIPLILGIVKMVLSWFR